jgi:hypothetical protein
MQNLDRIVNVLRSWNASPIRASTREGGTCRFILQATRLYEVVFGELTDSDEVMVNTQVEALGGGDLYYRLRHDKWFGVFCMSIFYLFLWPLIDFIYILLHRICSEAEGIGWHHKWEHLPTI